MSIEKTFDVYLLVNWKTGEMHLRKRSREGDAHGYWIPIHLVLQLVVPDHEPEISARIELSETKVRDIIVETLGE